MLTDDLDSRPVSSRRPRPWVASETPCGRAESPGLLAHRIQAAGLDSLLTLHDWESQKTSDSS